MNKIILEHVAASELPDKLRGDIPPDARVTITVEQEVPASQLSVQQLRSQADRIKADPAFRLITEDEAVERVRSLRDDWDR